MVSNIPRPNMAAMPDTPRILSVQSHVVSGYCGNKSATFPLQLLEFEMDIINSVQLSNHTQYKVTKGQIQTSKDFEELHAGLRANELTKLYDFVITGYVADLGSIDSLAKLVQDVKQARQGLSLDCWYTLDPVLGDDGVGYYVPNGPRVADAYKRLLLPLADILTPNRFEASILSGVNIDPLSADVLQQAVEAVNHFHKRMGVSIVALTSLEVASEPNKLICIVSYDLSARRRENNNAYIPSESREIWLIRVPKLQLPFTGTGDLFTALFTGWLYKSKFNLKETLENTANSIHDIIEDTLAWYHQSTDKSVQAYELRLVQNRDKIIKPGKRFTAEPLDINPGLSHIDSDQLKQAIENDNSRSTNNTKAP